MTWVTLVLTAAVTTGTAAADPDRGAPFTSKPAARAFSETLIERIAMGDFAGAVDLARMNSHLDDPAVQGNLETQRERLPGLLRTQSGFKTIFLEQASFGRSFLRHSYALDNGETRSRCMFTYRRKTDGWRLNQIWCD